MNIGSKKTVQGFQEGTTKRGDAMAQGHFSIKLMKEGEDPILSGGVSISAFQNGSIVRHTVAMDINSGGFAHNEVKEIMDIAAKMLTMDSDERTKILKAVDKIAAEKVKTTGVCEVTDLDETANGLKVNNLARSNGQYNRGNGRQYNANQWNNGYNGNPGYNGQQAPFTGNPNGQVPG